jgi:inhibitor of KinA sporulation pathway (predicted exonuclease)
MNYIIFDLEFNQPFSFSKNSKGPNPDCPFEIIDLGAVKLDENLVEVENFNKLVKPKLYTRIHPYVKRMTKISKEDLNKAKPFSEVYKEFIKLLDDSSVLCVWGTSDIKELIRNIEFHNLDASLIPRECINVQLYASKLLNSSNNGQMGLKKAVELLDIPLETKFHNAYYDAWYTAEIFKKINNDQIKPCTYAQSQNAKLTKHQIRKTTLDTDKLIMHFEKTFNREMTMEEQSIIKLAYKMGKTNQFRKATHIES